ncbi:hypothetical protein GKE82_19200 [Conexibacter sp. W3-3-2]|uniref:hypothetical protein n=1 Tax=Conexibacter sp. W3-3-2 TaxID=2675227 RepID=UPI0012B71DA6|nr:hypothetical protein [Conexibacter sp. W3-3-2]MTD46355.1 hypothetical protein [Conexibacter sp. W3-3-2]
MDPQPDAARAAAAAAIPVPIPGYDDLHACQILPRLEALDAEELARIEERERAGRARPDVLARAEQLRARREHERRLAR